MAKTSPGNVKILAKNRKAHFDYFIEDRYEAGVSLLGSEVKSIRAGHISLGESYAKFSANDRPELFLLNCHVAEYAWANRNNHDPLRPRKLLLHKRELARLSEAVVREGRTIIPLAVYLKDGKIKIELGLGKGKKLYDKRDTLKAKSVAKELAHGE